MQNRLGRMKQKHKVLYAQEALCYPVFYYLALYHFCNTVITETAKSSPEALKKAKVLSEFSKEKCIQTNSMLRILGSTQNWTGNPSKYEVYNIDMILKIIEIRDEKVIENYLAHQSYLMNYLYFLCLFAL